MENVRNYKDSDENERNQSSSSPSHVISVRHFQLLWYEVLWLSRLISICFRILVFVSTWLYQAVLPSILYNIQYIYMYSMCQASSYYVPTDSAGLSEVYCIRFSFLKASIPVPCLVLMWFCVSWPFFILLKFACKMVHSMIQSPLLPLFSQLLMLCVYRLLF